MTGTSVLGCLPGAQLGPKKLQNQQFYIIDWIREKTPGRCCQSSYLLLWWLWCTIEGLGTLRKCYVSSPVAKALVLDWKPWLAHNCFKEDFLRPGVSFWESGVQILQVSAFFGKCQMFFAATLCQLMVVSSFAVYRQTQKNLAVICFVTIHDCSVLGVWSVLETTVTTPWAHKLGNSLGS